MTKDRILLILSIAILGILAAFLFRRPAYSEMPSDATGHTVIREMMHEGDSKDLGGIHATSGKKAVLFKLSSASEIMQFLNPGMNVDLTFTSKSMNSSPEFGVISLTILKDIKILSLGQSLAKIASKSRDGGTASILLEMSPREAEILFYAQSAGDVALTFSQTDGDKEPNQLADLLLKNDGNFYSTLATYLIRDFFPDVDVKISATSSGYIVAGKVPDPQMAAKIIEILEKLAKDASRTVVNLLEVDPQQVLVSIHIFEVDSSLTNKLGLNWKVLTSQAGASLGIEAVFPRPASTAANYALSAQGWRSGSYSLSAFIDALEEDVSTKTIAEPNLTTISGQTAHFFAGGEFPIIVPQGNSSQSVTIEFKKFGVLLDFTPTVDLSGLITLHVIPEISTLDRQNSVTISGFVIPAVTTRKADTTVKLWPGQSYVIAGLKQNEDSHTHDRLMGLSQIPILGHLFKSKSELRKQKELLIVLTPQLVNTNRAKVLEAPSEPSAEMKSNEITQPAS